MTDTTPRIAAPEDHNAIMEVATAVQMFEPDELTAISGMLAQHFDDPGRPTHWMVAGRDGAVAAALCAPDLWAGDVYNLLFIGVHPAHHGACLLYTSPSPRDS